jgi:hypothetical protein
MTLLSPATQKNKKKFDEPLLATNPVNYPTEKKFLRHLSARITASRVTAALTPNGSHAASSSSKIIS